MLNIKELTQHVTTADRARFQQDKKPRGTDYISVTIEGHTVTVLGTILSRIALKAPTVEAVIVPDEPAVEAVDKCGNKCIYEGQRGELRLTSGTTTWTLYHQETK